MHETTSESASKRCSKCLSTKSASDFHVRRASVDGLSPKCKDCAKKHVSDWRQRNPEAHKEWYAANKDRKAEYWRKWYEANRDSRAESYSAWAKSNRGTINAIGTRRKKAIRDAAVPWGDKGKIKWFYDEAARLTAETGVRHEVDHIFPIRGRNSCGLHWEGNLRIVTREENARKKNRMPTLEEQRP